MFKLVTVAALSTVATAGLVLVAITVANDPAGDLGFLSSVSAVAVIVAFLALVVGLLERTHRRALRSGRARPRPRGSERPRHGSYARRAASHERHRGRGTGPPHAALRDVSPSSPSVLRRGRSRWRTLVVVVRVGQRWWSTMGVLRSGDAPFVAPVLHPADAGPDSVGTS